MQVVEQSWEWIQKPINPLQLIELAGRTCYKSEKSITPESAAKFVKRITESGHHSVIEHASASVRFITDRAVTHELVRHRLAAYSQESQRYVNYGSEHIQFIRPVWLDIPLEIYTWDNIENITENSPQYIWVRAMLGSEEDYKSLLLEKWNPQQARTVLPNSTKTEIVMSCNLREWMHVFKLRTSKAAYPQIRELMLDCLAGFKKEIPVLFDNIWE